MVSDFLSILILFNLFVLACVAIDSACNHRLHPAFGWGGIIAIGALDLSYLVATSAPWLRFGAWWVS
jgi:hypothetical protein